MLSIVPNDPRFAEQWALNNTGQTGGVWDADIDAPGAWSVSTGSAATVVAMLDTGINYTHEDLYLNLWINQGEIPTAVRTNLVDADANSVITFHDLNDPANASQVHDWNGNSRIDGGDLLADPAWVDGIDSDGNGYTDDLIGWDWVNNDNDPMDENGHGSQTAGILGSVGNNGVGVAGVNWRVQLMALRFQSASYLWTDEAAAQAIDYAVAMGASISSNSWGTNVEAGGTHSPVFDAIARAEQAGHLFVTSAGNFSSSIDPGNLERYPAGYDLDNILAVAATNDDDLLADFSNWGAVNVDLAAPGQDILRTNKAGGYGIGSGTSFATPHVAGVAALLKTLHPDWVAAELKQRIMDTVDPLPSLAGKTVTGGRLNAARAVATTTLTVDNPSVSEGASGSTALTFTITRGGDASGTVTVSWSTRDDTAIGGSDYVASSGQVVFDNPSVNQQTLVVNLLGDATFEANERFFVDLSVASGSGTLLDSTVTGTILNDDPPPTKFFVVNDNSTDRTYEYEASGVPIENYTLNSGNTAPRGAASTIAGDRVWVVDATKNVYVYNTSGGLLGSWSLGSLNSRASLQGIATNGTDVWVVDAYADKVYKYTGAASRTSGSQNAASSFSLNTGNKNPTDITTDGTALWVVDSSSLDKVFKYTLAGGLQGSWTIDAANATPTGITVDPAGASDVWIVDSSTDRVYQYTGAATRTSGSLAAASSFALAPGNTNPQGIADPPAPASPPSLPLSATAWLGTPDFSRPFRVRDSRIPNGQSHAGRSHARGVPLARDDTPRSSEHPAVATELVDRRHLLRAKGSSHRPIHNALFAAWPIERSHLVSLMLADVW